MKIKISNTITVDGLSPEQEKIITRGLSIENPVYKVMLRQNNQRALYAISPFIKYYKKTIDGLVVGRGVVPRLFRHFKDSIDDVIIDLSSNIISGERIHCSATLRNYQEGVIDIILKNTEGIIRLDTAYGKSVIALKLIQETQLKTLIVVPRLNLLRQFKADIKKFCGYDAGSINGKDFDVKDITIATIQTLKKRDLKPIRSYFGMCIYDECHTYQSDKGSRVVESFNPLRLYGMTATADRSDGQGEAIKFMFGDIIVDKKLPSLTPVVNIFKCDCEVWGDTYANMIESQVDNINRNKMIVEIASKEIELGRKIIILTKRTRHYELIHELLGSNIIAHKIKSKLSTVENKRQDELLGKLREGGKDFDVILGTFGLLSTGINIPALDTIIFAGDLKSSVLATQSVGRILRLFDGKQAPKIIDIDDVGSGILHNQARLRKKFYKENNWEINYH